jgi:hypothetical protein
LIRAAALSPNLFAEIEQAEVAELRQVLQHVLLRLGEIEVQLKANRD